MARPTKKGIDYFPLDVHSDSKTNVLIRKYGALGLGSLIAIYREIYKEGYYIEVDENFIEDLGIELSINEDLFNEIFAFLIRKKFFNNDLYNDKKILTSKGIQTRFVEATKRRKECAITLHSLINVNINSINVSNNTAPSELMQINVCNSTQSKVNKSKLNKTKVNNTKTKAKKETDYPFILFWNMYDKKTGKPSCEKKYENLSENDRALIFEHVLKYKESQPDKQYRKNPETYLNQKAWNDEIISSAKPQNKTFAQQQLERQANKGIATQQELDEAISTGEYDDEELF